MNVQDILGHEEKSNSEKADGRYQVSLRDTRPCMQKDIHSVTHRKTELLKGWLYKRDVLVQNLLQLSASLTDVPQHWEKQENTALVYCTPHKTSWGDRTKQSQSFKLNTAIKAGILA